MDLKEIGWSSWQEANFNNFCEPGELPARITIVDRDRYHIQTSMGERIAKLTGKFRHISAANSDYPCVGDWVCVQTHEQDAEMSITRVLPRKSFLRRKTAGKDIDYQMIGANIDVALIVQSCHYDFNLQRLERYLVMINEGNIEPLLVLTKVDLIADDELQNLISEIRNRGVNTPIIAISNVTGSGIDQIREVMLAEKTYCLVGSSGVGKTTLTNQLLKTLQLETKSVSGTGEGRHTTVRRQLLNLDNGAMLIDTPGMRELGILAASDGIESNYSDIAELSKQCRFNNCQHTNEPGCAVQSAIKKGLLDQAHFNNYLKLQKESEFYEMSYQDKRKKDKEFGKFVKTMKKGFSKKH